MVTKLTNVKCLPIQAQQSQSTNVDIIKARLLSEGFAEEVANMAAKPQRKASLSV